MVRRRARARARVRRAIGQTSGDDVRLDLILGAAMLAAVPFFVAVGADHPTREEMAAAITGDASAGERVFGTCRACHVADQEANRVGPHLVGLFGRTAGGVDGFNYSEAMASSGIVWTPETLADYLRDPRGYIPGNRMVFPGVADETQRADLLAYLFEATAPE